VALAEYYAFYERYSEAAKLYEEIVKIDPKNKKANFGLAEAYRILNKTDLAQKYYNITSLLDPSDVEPMFSNAKLLVETASGNELRASIEQALTKFELVRKINPDFPKVSYMIAKCYLELGDYDRAMEMIREEKSRNPNIADSYILAAEIFSRKSQYKECAAEYSAAIKIRPNKAELYVRASACYRNSDAVDIAQDMVDMAFQRESGFAENFREQGYVAEKTGDKPRAVTCLKLYLNYSPNALDRNAVESKIRQLGEDLNGTCRP
jgi:tetratricopeptide (TPR) repeat protein